MEDALCARLGEGQPHEGTGRADHDSADGEVPVRTMGGDVVVDGDGVGEAIGIERIVGALFELHLGGVDRGQLGRVCSG